MALGGLHPEYLVNLPVLLEVPGIACVALTEADIENYPNLYLTAFGARGLTAEAKFSLTDADLGAAVADDVLNVFVVPSFTGRLLCWRASMKSPVR